MATATRALPHTFDELDLHHDWPRTCEHCGITVFGTGATHCPQRALDAIAAAEAERDALRQALAELVQAVVDARRPGHAEPALWSAVTTAGMVLGTVPTDPMIAARELLAGNGAGAAPQERRAAAEQAENGGG